MRKNIYFNIILILGPIDILCIIVLLLYMYDFLMFLLYRQLG